MIPESAFLPSRRFRLRAAIFPALLLLGAALQAPFATAQQAPVDPATPPDAAASEPAAPQPEDADPTAALGENIQIDSLQTSYDPATGIATAVGDVNIRYGDVQILAGKAEYHRDSGDVFAKENVVIYKGGNTYRGEDVVYNTKTGEVIAVNLRSNVGALYFDSPKIDLNAENTEVVELENATLTTHDSETFDYHVKARSIEIHPDDHAIFRDVDIYLGDKKLLRLPYLVHYEDFGYSVTPGHSSRWGAFLLNRYSMLVEDHSLVTWHLDLRSKRGFAGGIDIESLRHRENPNFGELSLYYAYDNEPETNFTGRPRTNLVDEDRYRVSLQHRIYIPGPEESTLYLDIDINAFSDEFLLEDFFSREYRINPRPDNMVNIVKTAPGGELSVLGRFRINDFHTSDSRLPEIAWDVTRQPIFDTGLFYEAVTSAGLYEEEHTPADRATYAARIAALNRDLPDTAREIATLATLANGNQFARFDTYHQVLYPIAVTDGFSLVPRAGAGFTAYDNAGRGVGLGAAGGSDTRTYTHLGLEGSLKFTKLYSGAADADLGVDELRHVFQPYFNYSFVDADDLAPGWPLIDRYAPTTRLRPLDITQYPAIDEIRDWNILRVGMRNRLQTRRDAEMKPIGSQEPDQTFAAERGYTHNWLELNTFIDTYFTDPEFDRDFSNLFNELVWWPLPWMKLQFDSQIPVVGGDVNFSEYNTAMSFMPCRHTELSVGHRSLTNHPFLANSSLITFDSYTRFSDQWGFRTAHRFELDDSVLEMQQYSIHRDLSRWTLGIGGMILDNRVNEEYGILLTLSLKDLPNKTLPLSVFSEDSGATPGY